MTPSIEGWKPTDRKCPECGEVLLKTAQAPGVLACAKCPFEDYQEDESES